jgi:hypothetical protein
MMAHDWIVLREGDFLRRRTEQIGGVTTEVVTSPYDVPRAMRVSANPGLFTLEFRYKDEDEPGREVLAHDAVVHLGKDTGRVLLIECKLRRGTSETTQTGELLARIAAALEELTQRKTGLPSRDNYAVAKQAIERGSEQLAAVS